MARCKLGRIMDFQWRL